MGILSMVRGKINEVRTEARLNSATRITQQAKQAENDKNYYKFMLEKQKKIDAAESAKAKFQNSKKKQLARRIAPIKQALKDIKNRNSQNTEKRGSPFELGGGSGFGELGSSSSKEKKKNNPWNSGEGRNPFQ